MLFCVQYKLFGLHVLFVVGRVLFVVCVLSIGCNVCLLVVFYSWFVVACCLLSFRGCGRVLLVVVVCECALLLVVFWHCCLFVVCCVSCFVVLFVA